MQTFKPSPGPELAKLKSVALTLKVANEDMARATKAADAAKDHLVKWLKDNRGVDVPSLPIGELIQIEGVVLVEIAKMNKLDESALLLAEPAIHARWKRDLPVRKFKALV
jgi:hypothetical protein